MNTARTALLAFVIALGLHGCASTASRRVLSVDDVVRDAGQLEGRQIAVQGVLHFYAQHGSAQLWASRQALEAVSSGFIPPDDPIWDRCIDLRFRPSMASRLERQSGEHDEFVGVLYVHEPQDGELNLSDCSDLWLVIRTLG